MKLGVNVIRLTRPFTGVGRYVECLLDQWSSSGGHPFAEIVLFTHTPLRQEAVTFPLERYRIRIVGRPAPDPFWEWRDLRRAAAEVDVLFCPSYTIPAGFRGRCAVTYHGPAQNRPGSREWIRGLAYDALYRYSARRADHVFASSRAAKARAVGTYGVPPDRVSVTWLAASRHFRPIRDPAALDETRRVHGLGDEPYLLFVGKLSRRHYVPRLIEAFSRLKKRRQLRHRLVIAGPDHLGLGVARLARSHGVESSVIHLPFVPHRELPALYSAADLFVYPSSDAEGFGIPVVEAMACGVPVITTRAGSLPEFAEGAAFMTDSAAVAELEDAIQRLLEDPLLRRGLRDKGLARTETMTWTKTAAKTMDVLAALAAGR